MLLEFTCTTLKDRHHDEEHRRIFLVNLAQAYKWSGNPAKASAIIAAEDWTAASNKFKLATAVLREDFASATELMKKIGMEGEIHKAGYRDWPLFKEFRKSEVFRRRFGTSSANPP